MKRPLLVGFLLIFTFWTATSFAADPYKWTGFNAGIQGLGADGNTDWTYTSSNNTVDHRISGAMAGLFVGYNYQFPFNLVVGVETDINYGSIRGHEVCPNPDWIGESKVNWLGSTRLRVGYAFNRFLPYIALGPAYGRVNVFTKNNGSDEEFGETKTYLGFSPSVGVDFAVSKNLFVRAEYDYIYLGKKDMTVDFGNVVDTKVAFSEVKFAIGFTF